MQTAEPFSVYPNRSRLAAQFVGCVAFVAIGLWLALGHSNRAPIVRIIGWVVVVLSGGTGIWDARRLASRRPIVTISIQGIEEFSAGFLPRDHVAMIRLWIVQTTRLRPGRQKQPFLVIDLADPQAFMASRSPARRYLWRKNSALEGALVAIPLRFLPPDVDLPRLLREIRLRSDVAFTADLAALISAPERPDAKDRD